MDLCLEKKMGAGKYEVVQTCIMLTLHCVSSSSIYYAYVHNKWTWSGLDMVLVGNWWRKAEEIKHVWVAAACPMDFADSLFLMDRMYNTHMQRCNFGNQLIG